MNTRIGATGAVGVGVPHESAVGHVTGGAKYVDDLWPHVARLAHAWPVMAPHAHARVVSIDAAAARRQPGVLSILTAADVPGENDTGPARHDEPLFPTEVCFAGQAVAWVIADTEEAARVAAGAVAVEYAVLPAILTIEDAIAAGSFLTDGDRLHTGDAEAAIREAPHRLDGELRIGGQEHFYLETNAALAYRDDDGGLMVHSSTQHPSETQEIVARVLGVPKNGVVVQCLRMGGAFGGKEVQANAWAAVAALAVTHIGRPVRVRLTRRQDMVLTGKRHPFLARFRVGFADDGALLGVAIALFSDGGWSLDLSFPVLGRAMFHTDNCYRVPHMDVTGRVCRTHHVSQTAFRGFGGPQGMLVIEEIVDRVARALDLPPHVVRARNFYREGDSTHYGQVVRHPDRIARIWSELQATSGFAARSEAVAAFNAASPDVKRGLAITPVKFGISFTTTFFNQAGALVLVYRDGSVQVNHGGTEMGQGLHTKIQQIAADGLGVPLSAIRLMPTRTDKVPNTSATAASSGSDLNGAAVRDACAQIRGRLAEIAAARFNVPAADVVFAGARVHPVTAPEVGVPFATIVNEAYLARAPLFAAGYYRTPGITFDWKTGQGTPFHYFAYGAAVSEVEVDGFTGQYRLLRTDILHDVGDSLSPLVDRGQVEGGFVQGVGWLTTEELVWNADGAFVSHGASTYKLPTLAECPPDLRIAFLDRAHEPGVIHGSKAVGEPPLMLAISVREALRAAVAAFGRGGVVELGLPATPEAVYWALERGRT